MLYLILPEFQFGFRLAHSYANNLVTFSNRILLAGCFTVCIFIDITDAFDNIQPSILIETLRGLGVPAKICKFIQNLVIERNSILLEIVSLTILLTAHKGMSQSSSLSPILFNLYMILKTLGGEIIILMYVDDLVIFSSNASLNVTVASI